RDQAREGSYPRPRRAPAEPQRRLRAPLRCLRLRGHLLGLPGPRRHAERPGVAPTGGRPARTSGRTLARPRLAPGSPRRGIELPLVPNSLQLVLAAIG